MNPRAPLLAERMSRLGTETAFEVLAHARELESRGRTVVHLEIGEPDFDTPANIVEAAIGALRGGKTHYGPSSGLEETRAAIAEDFSRRRGVAVDSLQVVVLAGGKPAIFFGLIALVQRGDEVIYPNPGFPIYESMIEFSEARAVPIALREDNGFRMDVDELERLITPRTKVVIINSPHNPTGSVMTGEEIRRVAEITSRRGIWLFSDEIYGRMVYEGEHVTPLCHSDPERTIVLDGFSKTYAMTGWRLGYSISSKEMAVRIARLQTNCNSCPATFSQIAAVEALKGSQESVDHMVREFDRRRRLVVEGLNRLPGVTCVMPRGAFYAFANVQRAITGRFATVRDLQRALLDEAGVATLAGTAFGANGEGYLRLSYANSADNLTEALRRMDRFLKT